MESRGDKCQVFGWTRDGQRKGDRPFFYFHASGRAARGETCRLQDRLQFL